MIADLFLNSDKKSTLLDKKSATEAFDFVFSKEYLEYAFKYSVGLKKGRGIDGITLNKFEQKLDNEIAIIVTKVKNGSYKFSPYLEVLKSKGRDKAPRVLSTPTMRDKLTLFCLKDYLQYLFQSELSTIHANEHISKLCAALSKNKNELLFYRSDIENFYPSISQKRLLSKLRAKYSNPLFISLVEKSLCSPTKTINSKSRFSAGVPQGLSISNILADIYLHELDVILKSQKSYYGRFVDDVVLVGNRVSLINSYLRFRYTIWIEKLKINESKSEWGGFVSGIEFLGYTIKYNKLDAKIEVGVRSSSQQKLISSVCGLLTSFKSSGNFKHLYRLNRRISGVIWKNKRYGWLFYFSEINDLSILRKFDSIVAKISAKIDVKNFKFKKFTNTYWRVKNNKWGDYIANLDNFDRAQMEDFLDNVIDTTKVNVRALNFDDLERLFATEVQKEIDRMEKDVGDVS